MLFTLFHFALFRSRPRSLAGTYPPFLLLSALLFYFAWLLPTSILTAVVLWLLVYFLFLYWLTGGFN